MKKYLPILFFMLLSGSIFSQTAIGLRGGTFGGITAKLYTGNDVAFEFILFNSFGKNHSGLGLVGLYEWQKPLGESPLDWYYGLGAHIGSFNSTSHNGIGIGVDAILGLEYQFKEIPFNISLDAKPYWNFFGNTSILPGGALSLRYVF